eukprot:108368-Alexandrium_andersonii.AAC.1
MPTRHPGLAYGRNVNGRAPSACEVSGRHFHAEQAPPCQRRPQGSRNLRIHGVSGGHPGPHS